jgi:hypothetical protein
MWMTRPTAASVDASVEGNRGRRRRGTRFPSPLEGNPVYVRVRLKTAREIRRVEVRSAQCPLLACFWVDAATGRCGRLAKIGCPDAPRVDIPRAFQRVDGVWLPIEGRVAL